MSVRLVRERGFSLLAAMIVLMVVTLLVVGAIAFSSSERFAAVQMTREERLSGCTQAAKNLFLSQVRVLEGRLPAVIDAGIPQPDGTRMRLSSEHYDGGVVLTGYRAVRTGIGSSSEGINSMDNMAGPQPMVGSYYVVSALCQEREDGGNAAREIEFLVRIGL